MKAADFGLHAEGGVALVSTNSICQGQQVPILWPLIFQTGKEIVFAHTSFKWANLASHNAVVTVIVVGIGFAGQKPRRLYTMADGGKSTVKNVDNINAYLVAGENIIINPVPKVKDDRSLMEWGNKPTDGGNLFLTSQEKQQLEKDAPEAKRFIKRFLGAKEFIHGQQRYCLWIEDMDRDNAEKIPEIKRRISAVAELRLESKAAETRPAAAFPHRFRQIQSVATHRIIIARVSSENREFYQWLGIENATVATETLRYTVWVWHLLQATSLGLDYCNCVFA